MPEDGEDDEGHQGHGQGVMDRDGPLEAKEVESQDASDLEAGEHHRDDDQGLGPVPETFESFIQDNASHGAS